MNWIDPLGLATELGNGCNDATKFTPIKFENGKVYALLEGPSKNGRRWLLKGTSGKEAHPNLQRGSLKINAPEG
ncbi:hypothetical protein NFHSH190041_19110 [Shewanella sp. NFH-SH190041]|uniref:hypothetical protein n=1 Tax=Shewanella sp. NFH-SH190041 TaxID=2950245 RepID=UPI00220396F6|nr:hypothetical protein NFHSH190041_19110 [Shewanella sp. NFH-SH190041]